MTTSRVMALWCPDWPAVAAAAALGIPASQPLAVLDANRVTACTAIARAEGVRRGHRKREAQARCPELVVTKSDPDRDGRLFEPVIAAVDAQVPGVEVLRPGLIILSAAGPARYFGSETAVAERLIDAVAQAGAECQVGAADELSTAIIAARHHSLVPTGQDARFLAPLPVAELAGVTGAATPERAALVDLLQRLGLPTIGAFAKIPAKDVASRFGVDAIAAHRSARALPDRRPAVRSPPADLATEMTCDPPIERMDAAAFAGRTLAAQLHAKLLAANVACTRLMVTAYCTNGKELGRTWRAADPLTPAATADRVRWQLNGWLAQHHDSLEDSIIRLRLAPAEVVPAGILQLGIWGGPTDGDEQARRVLTRVQGLLGGDAVQAGVLSGGRGPAERITFITYGDERIPAADPGLPWPGKLPAPAPATLAGLPVVRLLDAAGAAVTVTQQGFFSASPTQLCWDKKTYIVTNWAGPWLIDEYWWVPASTSEVRGRLARVQLLTAEPLLLLLRYYQWRWQVEGLY